MTARKIAVVTGSRADFGHLSVLIHAIDADPALVLQLIATGSHLSEKHGYTVNEIEADGLTTAARVDLKLASDNRTAIVTSMGRGMMGFAEAFERLAPDLMIGLGDRYEILAAATSAMMQGIPIVHIHGGETTTGAVDESIRHAVSKMASVHLVAAEPYRARLIRMGEDPARVHNFGAPALEAIRKMTLLSKSELETQLSFTLDAPLAAVTFHPPTRSVVGALEEAQALFEALGAFPQLRIVMSGVNADAGSGQVEALVNEFAVKHPDRVKLVTSLGHRRYISLLALADMMIGNSSSGYIEGPALGIPVIDIGDRQIGRLAAPSIQRVAAQSDKIEAAIDKAFDPDFRALAKTNRSPYDGGPFAERAVACLKTLPLGPELLRKPFFDGAAA